MRDQIVANLKTRFDAYIDLVKQIDNDALTAKIDAPKHKSLAEHLWCVVGARESYARALKTGEWAGFACSMTEYEPADFHAKLNESARNVLTAIETMNRWTPKRDELLATLAEHEVMHEGQIIRHVLEMGWVANCLPAGDGREPLAWNQRMARQDI